LEEGREGESSIVESLNLTSPSVEDEKSMIADCQSAGGKLATRLKCAARRVIIALPEFRKADKSADEDGGLENRALLS
jgi:hypothetical protein